MNQKAANSLGTMALIATAALWGSNHVVARAAREAVPLPALVFWRWFPAAVVLTLVALPSLRRAWPAIRPRLAEPDRRRAVGGPAVLLWSARRRLSESPIEVGFMNATTRSGCCDRAPHGRTTFGRTKWELALDCRHASDQFGEPWPDRRPCPPQRRQRHQGQHDAAGNQAPEHQRRQRHCFARRPRHDMVLPTAPASRSAPSFRANSRLFDSSRARRSVRGGPLRDMPQATAKRPA